MWVVYLEMAFALALAIFIVWFTWPKKRSDNADKDSGNDGSGSAGGG